MDNSDETAKPSQYEDIIRITDTETKAIATVSVIVRNFPHKFIIKDMLTTFITLFTEALLISQSNGINTFDVIVDCEGTTKQNIDYTFGKEMIGIMKKVFDGKLNRCVIFNTNSLFRTVYTMFKPLIDKPTRQKIRIF